MKFVFSYTRVTSRTESIVVGSLIISSSFNHKFVVAYTKSFLLMVEGLNGAVAFTVIG